MGSYTDFKISGCALMTTKSYVEPIFMTVFRETDKKISAEQLDGSGGIGQHTQIKYAVTASVTKERLDVMGFSLRNARSDFDTEKDLAVRTREEEIRETEELGFSTPSLNQALQHDSDTSICDGDRDTSSFYAAERRGLEILRIATFDDFVEAFKYLRTHSLLSYLPKYGQYPSQTPELVTYMLRKDHDEGHLFGFPCSDPRFLMRAFLESVEECEEVSQDISSVVAAGYYDESDTVCRDALDSLITQYPINERIILLTEGSTDSRLLERTLDLLFPHLVGYYTFMDFDSSNAAGSAAAVVATIKAFCGVGISNRVIGLFDNDTASEDAIRGLKRTSLPNNIRFMRYPTLELAKCYPTMGPGGVLAEMDVNGLACSLELYFGSDVLKTGSTMTPIQWTGYSKTLQRYQGEILDKSRLIDSYEQKLEQCEADHSRVDTLDFSGMRTLFNSVFAVFQ